MAKTNAVRLLEAADIKFNIHEYDTADGEISGVTVARKMGQNPDCVFKTLITEGKFRCFI